MKSKLIIIVSAIMLSGCSQPEHTKNLLAKQGYTDIETHGFSLWGCSEDDTFSTKFTAKKGREYISGVVCGGLLKGSTVRFD